jgi:DNA-binding NarL/FixJ family response regulator
MTSTATARGTLIGRARESAELDAAVGRVRASEGGLLLIAGDAGVGKTRLAEDALQRSGLLFLRGDAFDRAPPPYGPIVAALRAFLRADPQGLDRCGRAARYLRVLLPELGRPPRAPDRASVFEGVRCAFCAVARRGPAVVILDDLHWADATTLELLPSLAGAVADEPVLLVGAYRSDETPRGHPLRRMRVELRRAGRLRELALEALDADATTALAAHTLGVAPSDSLAVTIHDRTQGVPFFVEELCAALVAEDRVAERAPGSGLELVAGGAIPVPDTVRDATIARIQPLSPNARRLLEVASVAGLRFDLALVADVAGSDAVDEPVSLGVLVETEPGVAAFRHALIREAVYREVPWGRRRDLHSRLAELLEDRGERAALVAEHWVAAHEPERARSALMAAAREYGDVHAHRDALASSRSALELCPAGDDRERIELLERIGRYAELCGDLADAVVAFDEAAAARRALGDVRAAAELDRRLAVVHELQGVWESALTAHHRAARGFARTGQEADAAAELLAAGSHLDGMGSATSALELARKAANHADRAGRRDLIARALGLEGSVRAKLGDLDEGAALARDGLSLALAEDLTDAATELYQRVAAVLENAADLGGAERVYTDAYDFCVANQSSGAAQVCLVCLAYILWETGRWEDAEALEREIIASPESPAGVVAAARSALAIFRTARGQTRGTRRTLVEGLAFARQHDRLRFEFNCLAGLAWLDELEGDDAAAAARYREIVRRRGETEDRHYAPIALRAASTFFVTRGDHDGARSCAAQLADMAAATTNRETLAALAHALGELALIEDMPDHAVVEFGRALDLLRDLELPYARAQTQVRAAAALDRAGERELAAERLTDAYRTARKLGAQPLADHAARRLEALGERVEERLGRRAAGTLARGGLTRRELEVLRFVAVGRTNREIAQELYLSTRTIDMHVRSILAKLRCTSRAEATRRARDLGLVV